MSDSIYKTCKSIVAGYAEKKAVVLDIDNCLERARAVVDFSDMTEEEKEDIILKSTMTIALNNYNYYSAVRRHGYYVSIDNCHNKAYLEAIKRNAEGDVKKYETLVGKLDNRIEFAEINGQMEFDISTGEISEQLTQERFIAMLAEEAKREA